MLSWCIARIALFDNPSRLEIVRIELAEAGNGNSDAIAISIDILMSFIICQQRYKNLNSLQISSILLYDIVFEIDIII